MGKVCVSHDTLLITDNDSTTQDDKSPPPCMQLQAGVGFNFLPSNTNPPPRLQLRDGVGFFPPFLQVNERRQQQPTPSLAIARRGGFVFSCTPSLANASGGYYMNILFN